MKKSFFVKLILSIVSGLLLSASWILPGTGWIAFIAFVPLLIITGKLMNSGKKNSATEFAGFSFVTFIIWNSATTWWIFYSTIAGAIVAIMMTSVFMSVVMFISFRCFEISGRRLGYLVFVTNWIAFEYLFMHSQVSWPWLILGNAFANNISLIQWYEFTGQFGGSLWILVVNVLIYEIYRRGITKTDKHLMIRYSVFLVVILIVPVTYSVLRYVTYEETEYPVNMVVIQPNIDPYKEKFTVPVKQQLNIFTDIASDYADNETDYFVCPETALPNGIWENEISDNYAIAMIRDFLSGFPDAKFIIGATTRLKYPGGKDKSDTADKFGNTDDYYDLFNSSLQVDTSVNVLIYHKSRLVPGVEVMPYPHMFGFLKNIMLDLGGMTGSHGVQKEREVFANKNPDISTGVPICYESVYGEFITEFVSKGANILVIITNDGWWGDTPGYKQHMSYARLRAVETRRSIARCANTGISCFINQRGDIIQHLDWWQRGAIKSSLNANNEITFYVLYGDYIARMSIVVSFIVLLFQSVLWVKRRIIRQNG